MSLKPNKKGIMAMEGLVNASGLNIAQEGISGAALGFLLTYIWYMNPLYAVPMSVSASISAEKFKKDIKIISEELHRAVVDSGKQAVKDGKITSKEFETKFEPFDVKAIFISAFTGYFLGPFYAAFKTSEIEDLRKELNEKCDKLNVILSAEAKRQGISMEGYEKFVVEPDSAVSNGDAIVIAEGQAYDENVTEELENAQNSPEVSMLAMEDALEGVIQLDDQVQEAVSVIETMDGINEQLSAATAEDGLGLSAHEAEPIRIAVEAFKVRTGYQDKLVFPAMESFGGKTSKREGAKLALESNQQFVADLKNGIRYAQESLVEKIKETMGLASETDDKLSDRLQEVDSAYEQGEIVEDSIVKPAWGSALNTEGAESVSGFAVAALLQSLVEARDKANLVGSIRSGAKWLADGSSEDEAAEIQEKAGAARAAVDAVVTAGQGNSTEADFEPATREHKVMIVELLKNLLDDDALVEAQSSVGEGEDSSSVWTLVQCGLEFQAHVIRAAHAAISYLACSVRKAQPAAESDQAEETAE